MSKFKVGDWAKSLVDFDGLFGNYEDKNQPKKDEIFKVLSVEDNWIGFKNNYDGHGNGEIFPWQVRDGIAFWNEKYFSNVTNEVFNNKLNGVINET